jgi:hypothetical protein
VYYLNIYTHGAEQSRAAIFETREFDGPKSKSKASLQSYYTYKKINYDIR